LATTAKMLQQAPLQIPQIRAQCCRQFDLQRSFKTDFKMSESRESKSKPTKKVFPVSFSSSKSKDAASAVYASRSISPKAKGAKKPIRHAASDCGVPSTSKDVSAERKMSRTKSSDRSRSSSSGKVSSTPSFNIFSGLFAKGATRSADDLSKDKKKNKSQERQNVGNFWMGKRDRTPPSIIVTQDYSNGSFKPGESETPVIVVTSESDASQRTQEDEQNNSVSCEKMDKTQTSASSLKKNAPSRHKSSSSSVTFDLPEAAAIHPLIKFAGDEKAFLAVQKAARKWRQLVEKRKSKMQNMEESRGGESRRFKDAADRVGRRIQAKRMVNYWVRLTSFGAFATDANHLAFMRDHGEKSLTEVPETMIAEIREEVILILQVKVSCQLG